MRPQPFWRTGSLSPAFSLVPWRTHGSPNLSSESLGWKNIIFMNTVSRMGKQLISTCGGEFLYWYKSGAGAYHSQAIDQVLDYTLDLKNFHEKSSPTIVPVLVARAPELSNR